MSTSAAPTTGDIVGLSDRPGERFRIHRASADSTTYGLTPVDTTGTPIPAGRKTRAHRNRITADPGMLPGTTAAAYVMPAEVPATGATVGMLREWLKGQPDNRPVILARDDTGDRHAPLYGHTDAVAKTIPGGMGFVDAWWDQTDATARDLLDYMPPADAQRVFVLIPQV